MSTAVSFNYLYSLKERDNDFVLNKEIALDQARKKAITDHLPYAGSIKPEIAWQLFSLGDAYLIDVRTREELVFVGRVPDSLHIPWATGTNLTRNPRFIKELEAKTRKTDVILFLCRSGKRSALAAEAATKAGFQQVFNIEQGFEGEIDEQQQRGKRGGWRYANLLWVQD